MSDALTGQTVELLQQMIRNQCVNDGTLLSGQEKRTTDTLRSYLEGSGLDLEVYEPAHAPGRASLVARIEGTDPKAPTLCLMGHTDVVPVNPKTWTRDPFGGELVDGEVWGRGAIDMLNLTASQAVALKTLAGRGWRPRVAAPPSRPPPNRRNSQNASASRPSTTTRNSRILGPVCPSPNKVSKITPPCAPGVWRVDRGRPNG